MGSAVEKFKETRRQISGELELFADRVWGLRSGEVKEAAELLSWFRFFAPTLVWHHRIEENLLYPLLLERLPELKPAIQTFNVEHAELVGLVAGVDEALAGFVAGADRSERVIWRSSLSVRARRLCNLTADHFSREQDALLDLVHRHIDAQAMKGIVEAARASTASAQGAELVPWLAAHSDSEGRRRLLQRLPLSTRLMYRWRWQKRYEQSTGWLRNRNAAA